jgi:hypothetical protein
MALKLEDFLFFLKTLVFSCVMLLCLSQTLYQALYQLELGCFLMHMLVMNCPAFPS